MKNTKRKMTIFLAVMLALAACGGKSSSPTSPSVASSTPKTSQTSEVSGKDTSENNTSQNKSSSENKSSSQQEGRSSQQGNSSQQQGGSSEHQGGSSEHQGGSSEHQGGSSEQPGSSEQQGGSSEETPTIDPALAPYILQHTEGEKANYIFEAENTDTRGKSGTGYSGGTSTYRDFAATDDSGRGYVTYLYREGISINFFVVSDRDVNNAKLSVSLGAEFMRVFLNPDNYTFRVDPDILATDPDALKEIADGGCLGNWDEFFLNWYTIEETGGYIINPWDCVEIDIGDDGCELGDWSVHTITLNLSLKKGFNCISLITNNNEIEGDSPHGTMGATAPVVDYIAIETTAQLGVFGAQDLGQGGVNNAVHFAN